MSRLVEGRTRTTYGRRVEPWFTLSVVQGNVIQIGGLIGSALLARAAGRRGERGTPLMVASRLLAYFTEHAFSTGSSAVPWASGLRGTAFTARATPGPTRRR